MSRLFAASVEETFSNDVDDRYLDLNPFKNEGTAEFIEVKNPMHLFVQDSYCICRSFIKPPTKSANFCWCADGSGYYVCSTGTAPVLYTITHLSHVYSASVQ